MRKIAFFIVFTFLILFSNGARASRCKDLSSLLVAFLNLDKEKHEKQIEFIKNYLVPSVGARMGNPEQGRFRSCKVGKNCFEIEGEGLEKKLKVKWSSQVAEPDLEITDSERILILPMDYPLNKLRDNEGQAMINRWTLSTSLYPFSRAPEKITRELGLEGVSTHVPREIQDNAIAVGNELLKIGRSFLYVAPTGTGKSYVLASLLRNQIILAEKKLHIVTVHQNELVGQMAKEFLPEHESGEIILLWPGAEDPILRPNLNNINSALKTGKPVVVATSIQSITGRKSSTGVYDGMVDELTDNLATIVMDETHHVGATTWGAKIEYLRTASDAKFIGASATPIHKDAHVQKVFDERAYWAYADNSVDDVVKKAAEGQSLFRPIKEVIDQAIAAIDSGELAPVENFYSINAEGLETSWDVARRMAPLIDRHRSGFIAVENRKVAEGYLAAFEKVFGDRKKFVVFHAGLNKQKRAEIYNRMRSGEDLFLVVVNLLDEGVDFPHMSLYIDLNRKMNARNLLQRMGRVERPFSGDANQSGKEYCEVATLTDWTDNDTIAEHLALLTAFQKNAAKFRGRRARIEMVDPEGMIAINEEEMNHEFKALLDNVRNIMKEKTAPGPWDRMETEWRNSGGGDFVPPKNNENSNDYSAYLRIKTTYKANPQGDALKHLPRDFATAIKNHFDNSPQNEGPWDRMETEWRKSGRSDFVPPKTSENKNEYKAYLRIKTAYEANPQGDALKHLPRDFATAIKNHFDNSPQNEGPWDRMETEWRKSGRSDFVPPKTSENINEYKAYLRIKTAYEANPQGDALKHLPRDFATAIKNHLDNSPKNEGPWDRMDAEWRNSGRGDFVPPKTRENKNEYKAYLRIKTAYEANPQGDALKHLPRDFATAIKNHLDNSPKNEGPWDRMEAEWRNSGRGDFVPPKKSEKYNDYHAYLKIKTAYEGNPQGDALKHLPADFAAAIKKYFDKNI